jgi:hypothetical protein
MMHGLTNLKFTQGLWKTFGMKNFTYLVVRLSLGFGSNLHVLTHSIFKCDVTQKLKKKMEENLI